MLRLAWTCALLFCGAAQAQFAASAGVDSEYRFRGVSLSDGRPGLRLSLSYDHPGGAYAGTSATEAELARGQRYTQLLGYAGFVTRTEQGCSWEFGLSASHFGGDSSYDYAEVFAGLLTERWSLRVYYAPDYFGRGQATAYAELDGHLALAPPWRLFGHAGALAVVGGVVDRDTRTTRTDLRAGLGLTVASFDVQLAWVGASRGGPYPADYGGMRRTGWVLSASASF